MSFQPSKPDFAATTCQDFVSQANASNCCATKPLYNQNGECNLFNNLPSPSQVQNVCDPSPDLLQRALVESSTFSDAFDDFFCNESISCGDFSYRKKSEIQEALTNNLNDTQIVPQIGNNFHSVEDRAKFIQKG